ncbi:MAG: 1-deoxy-D-xylulose-5-phosphate reductoisomerase [Abditibacteriota bacterium]|nr:1-deoxy-D-xylulose-5-phosphate reductoisomerase [Abditibacteriota bacterium]
MTSTPELFLPRPTCNQPKSIVILGSTGSIGRQALEVAKARPDLLRVVGLAAHSNTELFAAQIAEWRPQVAALWDEDAAQRLRSMVSGSTKILGGSGGVEEVATWPQSTLVLGAMLGAAGLGPTMAAIRAGKDIAIANKETLVAAGQIVTVEAREHGVALLPVDSEHSAIAQCLRGEESRSVTRLTITASGGPFVDTPRSELETVSPERALKHPTWAMGRKITIDSASLMNKVLESIEAYWLFDVPMEQIDVLVHRQSIVHSLVTFCDNSVKAQLGVPDMRLPIQWALLHPERVSGSPPPLDLFSMGPLSFEKPDAERFPSLNFGREVMQMGGTAPCAMNAANEVAVEAFLARRTGFYGITNCIAAVLERHENVKRPALDDIADADAQARRIADEWITRNSSVI